MRLVGLTGGIGSGKSTVAGLLRPKGAAVVDADEAARAVVEPGKPALAALAERFGDRILDPTAVSTGRPRRESVRRRGSRRALDGITWPAIGEEFGERIAEAPADAIVICDVPLLVESEARGPSGSTWPSSSWRHRTTSGSTGSRTRHRA